MNEQIFFNFWIQFSARMHAIVRALTALSDSIYRTACNEYRKEFGKLPGSERTRRLRKKRRKIVIDWFMAELELV